MQVSRVLLALIAAPLVSVFTYTLVAYGATLFFPFVYFVAGMAFTLTLLVYVPIYLILLFKRWTSLPIIVGTAFAVTFIVFVFGYLWMGQGFTNLHAGGEKLVTEGQLTTAGYMSIVNSSLTVAATAALGGLVFWLVAHCRFPPARGLH